MIKGYIIMILNLRQSVLDINPGLDMEILGIGLDGGIKGPKVRTSALE